METKRRTHVLSLTCNNERRLECPLFRTIAQCAMVGKDSQALVPSPVSQFCEGHLQRVLSKPDIVTDAALRSSTQERVPPQPEKASALEAEFRRGFDRIVERIWPAVDAVQAVCTGDRRFSVDGEIRTSVREKMESCPKVQKQFLQPLGDGLLERQTLCCWSCGRLVCLLRALLHTGLVYIWAFLESQIERRSSVALRFTFGLSDFRFRFHFRTFGRFRSHRGKVTWAAKPLPNTC